MERPFLVTLLRVALPAAGLCCDLVAEELPLLTGCATLVPEPPLTCEELGGRLAVVADEREVVAVERVVLPVEGLVTVDDEREVLPLEGLVWVAD
ncbi:MAG: hypothetical protein ACI4UJ_08765 [Candidatus Cryptobacteroides sp.]